MVRHLIVLRQLEESYAKKNGTIIRSDYQPLYLVKINSINNNTMSMSLSINT
ncbi:hypothetical protein JHK82_056484 [Glycine max]|nr:hypothetical protein JHK86_056317 [Glycine max]KAG5077789.1 hypothetical protein JHK82_056484 [Glycine max]